MSKIQNCQVDLNYFEAIRESTETYGMADHNPGSEWPWNVISTKAIAYSCGAISREGEEIEHNHDAEELSMCIRLAKEVTEVAKDIAYCGRNPSDEPPSPFYVVANIGASVPQQFDESFIRHAFGGTIYPRAEIWIEPLEERGDWWSDVISGGFWYEDDDKAFQQYLQPWRNMIDWFHRQPELHGQSFVQIGKDPLDENFENGGSVFPRLALAITQAGSIVGLWTRIVSA